MNSSSPRTSPETTPADRLSRLLEMGFERVEPGATTTESVRLDARTHKVTQIRPAMGSFVSITALHGSHDLAEQAIGAAFAEMDRLIALLNRFDGGSALSCLNDAGRIAGAPPELVEVIERALAFGRLSGGAFDVTVKPIIDLFRDPTTYAPRAVPPGDAELRDALELVGAEHVELRGRDVRLRRTGMGLTLDGIAKGYVVDGVAAALEREGVARYLVNAGGDIRTGGERGDGCPWTVAVRNPGATDPSWDSAAWDRGLVPGALRLTDGAVATSGSYEVYFDNEQLAHHIVQADSGRSPGGAVSVTVTARSTIAADALATAVFVLGPARGIDLIERTPGCEGMIIDRQGNLLGSRGWQRHTGASPGSGGSDIS